MEVELTESWKAALNGEFSKDYFVGLNNFVNDEYSSRTVYPAPDKIFRALDATPLETVRVVILGQDPYHGEVGGQPQAQGLSFSVPTNFPLPPSLKNIFKELASDLGGKTRANGDLSDWSNQGVLLLNATLTVRSGHAGSHQNRGWEEFTDSIIKTVSDKRQNVVFVLWGNYAQSKKYLIDQSKHLVLEAPHPSPLSAHRGFFGSKPFSKINKHLAKLSSEQITWS